MQNTNTDNRSMTQQSNIFQEEICNESQVQKQKRYQDALKNSMMARGAKDEPVQNIKNNFPARLSVARHSQQKMTYQQATNMHYGFQGVLLKESPNLFGGWDERYCILKGQRFVYKQNKYPSSINAGILNFNLLSCQIKCQKQGNYYECFTIVVANADKKFIFKSATIEDTTQWVRKLTDVIFKSQGFGKKLSYLSHYPRFWRKDYESQGEFRKTAQTGDVLLFRGTKNSSMMQRVITGDQFDHVGVVLLNMKGQVLFLQANGGFGVGICPWNKFISKKWYHQYDLVVHRHLNINRNQNFLQEVDKFVAKNMGKKYDFSLKEYIFNRSSTKQNDRQVFFCSSLVAKLYKILELLDQNKSCTQYLPSWFGNSGGSLRGNGRYGPAHFDDEKIIVFENIE